MKWLLFLFSAINLLLNNELCYASFSLESYGPIVQDTSLEKAERIIYKTINLTMPVKYFGNEYSQLQINNLGYILFPPYISGYYTALNMQYVGVAFYLTETNTNACHLTDTDLTGLDRNIFYRQSADKSSALLRSVTQKVRHHHQKHSTFVAEFAFVITFSNVTKNHLCDVTEPRNTFQLILTTNRTSTFAIFGYQKISWTGTSIDLADVGFTSRRGLYRVHGAKTNNVTKIAEWSNIGVPGTRIYRIDQNRIESTGERDLSCAGDAELCAIFLEPEEAQIESNTTASVQLNSESATTYQTSISSSTPSSCLTTGSEDDVTITCTRKKVEFSTIDFNNTDISKVTLVVDTTPACINFKEKAFKWLLSKRTVPQKRSANDVTNVKCSKGQLTFSEMDPSNSPSLSLVLSITTNIKCRLLLDRYLLFLTNLPV